MACIGCGRKCPLRVLQNAWRSLPEASRPPFPKPKGSQPMGRPARDGPAAGQRPSGRKLGDFFEEAEDQQPAPREKKPPASRAPPADTVEGIKAKCKRMREEGLSEEIVCAAEAELTAKLPPKPQRSASAEYNALLSKLQRINKSIESKQKLRDDKAEHIETLQKEIIDDDAELGVLQVDRAKLEAERAASQQAAAHAADEGGLPPLLAGAPQAFLQDPQVVNYIRIFREMPTALEKFLATAAASAAAAAAAPEPAAVPPTQVPESAAAATPNSGSGGSDGSNADVKPDVQPADDSNDTEADDAEMGDAVPTTLEEAAAFVASFPGISTEPADLKRVADELDKTKKEAVKRAKLAPSAERP